MTTFLKQLRQKHKLSQEFLAQKIGVSRPTYAQIESGARDISVKEARKLAEIFGLSLANFLAEKNITEPEIKFEKNTQELIQKTEMRISVPQEKVEKFKEVLLYILEKIGARPNIGEAVICKLMYFIDFDYYEKYEEQLMGAVYIKNHFGPTPAAFPKIIKEMEQNGELVQITQKYFQHDQKKYLPLKKSKLEESNKFSAREKKVIDEEIERFKDFNATQMREYSHKDVPWIGADNLQAIDYEAVFARTDEFSVRQYDDD